MSDTVTPTSTCTGAEALVDVLRAAGVERVFGLPGVHNLAIWSALGASPIEVVGVRHEQTAVYAADGAARVSGALGVAITTTGPGAANALGATGEAWASGSPVLVIATDIPTTLRRPGSYRGVLHETRDQAAMFAPVTKATFVARGAEEIASLAQEAVATALAAPTQPVYLEIPTDLLRAPVSPPAPAPAAPEPLAPDADVVADAAARLQAAQRPLIWAGGGAVRAGADTAVAELARLLDAPVVETYQGRGLLPLDHPGKVTVSPHDPHVGGLWDEADVVLVIGSDLDGMMTQNFLLPQPPQLIAIGVDGVDATKSYPADVLIEADAARAAEALCEALRALPPHASSDDADGPALRERQDAAYAAIAESDAQAVELLRTLGTLPPDTVVFADMCIAGYWIGSYHPFGRSRRLGYPVGWGTLGFAFPASLGAAMTAPDPVLCVAGDGGFLFACGELAALAQEQTPLTILIVDDGGYGMLRYDQVSAGEEPEGVNLYTPDFVALGEAFGIASRRVGGLGEELADALSEAFAARAPRLLVVEAALRPPVSTSPRWYRRAAG